jgi:two-component system, chemotaxis family, protein-glutamate methylesterase/glutaminase
MPPRARVLIVDDSRIFRSALEAALAGQEGIDIVGSVFSGQKAVEFIQANPPDIVTLDVEMPGMDGLETLRAIQRFNAGRAPGAAVGVIMVSAYTKHGADVTIRALQDGAFDFVTKPAGPNTEENRSTLQQQLSGKIHLFMAGRRRRLALSAGTSASAAAPATASPARTGPSPNLRRQQWARLRTVRALVIASSTGGPKALETLLPELRSRTDLPILIVQHMPPKFTQSFAESLGRLACGTVVEARDGQVVGIQTTYIAPGGQHLLVRQDQGRLLTAVNQLPPENGCRPSADVLFRSIAAAFQGNVVALVLTGMGRDGTAGAGAIKRVGGYVIAQDEATSVVWGMPGSVVAAGLADETLPLSDMAAAVATLVSRAGAD